MSAEPSDSEKIHPYSRHIARREAWLAPLGILAVLLACGLFWYASSTSPIGPGDTKEKGDYTIEPRLPVLGGPFTNTISSLYVLQTVDNGNNDIFLVTLSPTATASTTNVTQSPELSEFWPVPSHSGDMLAYCTIDEHRQTALLVLFPDGKVKTTAIQSTNSELGTDYEVDLAQPPMWSTHDEWIAFLGRCAKCKGDIVELFVMPVTGNGSVKRLTDHGHQIVSPLWLDDTNLVYVETRSSGKATLHRVSVSQSGPSSLKILDFQVSGNAPN
jgi:Tol biopolymer transport system component